MKVKDMDNRIGEQLSLIVDDQPWSPEVSYLYKKTPPVVPRFFEQVPGRYLEDFPMLCAARNRLNAVLGRVAQARASVERELRR